jgi:2-dehydropantoate 2-reductase
MRIAVMGAGGIGGYVGGRLAEAGEDVCLIARGVHLAALEASGLSIESPHGDVTLPTIRAVADPRAIGPVDLVLFAVKLTDADAAARSLAPIVAAHTKIVTLQNGVDGKEIVSRHISPVHVAAGIIYLAAYIKAPGVIINPGGVHRMVIDRMGGDPVLAAFFAACDRAIGIEAQPTDHIQHMLWEKFIVMIAFAGATGISRLPVGAVRQQPETMTFMRQLINETVAVARAMGQDFDDGHADRVIALSQNQPYEQKASMLVDLEAGRPLELPWLHGRVAALGQQFAIPTPANAAVLAALAAYVDGPPRLEKTFEAKART